MAKWIPLRLTTPMMKDATVFKNGGSKTQVTYAQTLLKEHSGVYHCDPGIIDGVWGIHSHNATRNAKYYIGYRVCDPDFGSELANYLNGNVKIPVTKRVLGAKRRRVWTKQHAKVLKRVKAVEIAKTQVGNYYSDSNKFSIWYGIIGSWCAMFLTWCGVFANQKSFDRGSRYAYVPFVTADAISNRNGLSVTPNPEEGDIVIYHWPGGNFMGDHIGRFIGWVDRSAGTFMSIEGNTETNGVGSVVAIKERTTSEVVHFIRAAE